MIKKSTDIRLKEINVDSSALANDFLMQFQEDISNISTREPKKIRDRVSWSRISRRVRDRFIEIIIFAQF
jgi:beta-glucosidase/6-phospho-beta-glucosidase/beta-galactosidase